MERENQYLQYIEPTELLAEELDEPLKAIARIFDNTGVETLKTELWEMLKACSRARSWSYLSDPSLALDCQRLMKDMIDALYLELKKHEAEFGKISNPKYVPYSAEQDEIELEFLKSTYVVLNTFKGRIRRLDVHEVQRPHLVLKKFFGIKSPFMWKSKLTEWVDFALGKVSMFEVFEGKDTLWDYEQFERLIEAAHLMHLKKEREYMPQEYIMETAILEQYFGAYEVGCSSKLEFAMVNLLKTVPASRTIKNLRKVSMDFAYSHLGAFPADMKEIVTDVVSLIELLELAEEEQRRLKIEFES